MAGLYPFGGHSSSLWEMPVDGARTRSGIGLGAQVVLSMRRCLCCYRAALRGAVRVEALLCKCYACMCFVGQGSRGVLRGMVRWRAPHVCKEGVGGESMTHGMRQGAEEEQEHEQKGFS